MTIIFLGMVKSPDGLPAGEPVDKTDELSPRDHARTKAFEVFSIDLAVDELHTLGAQSMHKLYKRKLARIALFTEHTLSKEGATHSYAVQTTHQSTIEPGLGAVRIAFLVQTDIGRADLIRDPGAFLSKSCHSLAIGDDLAESGVDTKLEDILLNELPHALTFLQLFRE